MVVGKTDQQVWQREQSYEAETQEMSWISGQSKSEFVQWELKLKEYSRRDHKETNKKENMKEN